MGEIDDNERERERDEDGQEDWRYWIDLEAKQSEMMVIFDTAEWNISKWISHFAELPNFLPLSHDHTHSIVYVLVLLNQSLQVF